MSGSTAISRIHRVGSALPAEDPEGACCLAVRTSHISFLMCFGYKADSLIIVGSGTGKQEAFLRLCYLNLALQLCPALGLLTPCPAVNKLAACSSVGFCSL